MSSPRYNWWPFVLNMIKDYPKRKMDYDDLHEQTVTASITGMTGGGSASRKTENTALRQLPAQEQREYDAVKSAVLRTKQAPDGSVRLKVIKLTLWRNQFTIPGVADRLHITESKAKQYFQRVSLGVVRGWAFRIEAGIPCHHVFAGLQRRRAGGAGRETLRSVPYLPEAHR